MNDNTLVFATNNAHKVEEIKTIIGSKFNIITLQDAGIDIDIPEPYDTIEENAATKSETIYKLTGKNCFGEDTGLEVEALNGAPGVKSARYAGDTKNFDANIDKLLTELADTDNRQAHFKTIISLIINGEKFLFEGICEGKILYERRGSNGFGYDPVFMPDGSNKSFAEMMMDEKNSFSHRRKATDKLIAFLQTV